MNTEVTITDWSWKSIDNFKKSIKKYCPNGMLNGCDGAPLERGQPWKEKCPYRIDGRCCEVHLEFARKCADSAARRREDE